MRYALYFTPPADHPLVKAAESWLGRSAFGRDVAPATIAGRTPAERAELVADPVRYGFHGTLKAPFRLQDGCKAAELVSALEAYATARAAITPLRLEVSRLGGFLALTPAGPVGELASLAGEIVRHFDGFRAPASEAEIARRRPDQLTPQQRDYLSAWGYPYVFEAFRFHMTLTGRLEDAVAEALLPELAEHFAAALAEPVAFDHLALFEEPAPGAPFTCQQLVRLSAAPAANQ